MTANIAHSRFGRALIAIRDAEVAAEATGISKPRLLVTVFLFCRRAAAVAGGLFATLQTYITPDAFTFDLSVLFFIAILIGGRGSILGPLLGTIMLTLLPEFAAPLVAWSTFLYAALLLVIVLAMPGGIAELLDFSNRRPLQATARSSRSPALLPALLDQRAAAAGSEPARRGARVRRRARDRRRSISMSGPAQVHGLIGPNGSGKTTTLNVISGYYTPRGRQRDARPTRRSTAGDAGDRAPAAASPAPSRRRAWSARPRCCRTS